MVFVVAFLYYSPFTRVARMEAPSGLNISVTALKRGKLRCRNICRMKGLVLKESKKDGLIQRAQAYGAIKNRTISRMRRSPSEV